MHYTYLQEIQILLAKYILSILFNNDNWEDRTGLSFVEM